MELGRGTGIAGILLLVAAGSALGGFGWGYHRGEELGVSRERERVLSLRVSPAGTSDKLVGILAIPDFRSRLEAVMEFVEAQEPGDARNVAAAFRASSSYLDAASFAVLAEWWARHAPLDAISAFSNIFYGARRAELVTIAIQEYARSHPERARDFVEGPLFQLFGEDPRGIDSSRTALVWGWAESGKPGYWEYAASLPTGPPRQRALEGIATWMLLHRGPDALLDFAENLDPGGRESLKLQFHRRAAFALALRDPVRAGEWALEQLDSPFGDGMLIQVLNQWGALDGSSALEWARGLPMTDESDRAIWEAYRQWIGADRSAALGWMRDNGPGPEVLQPAVALYIRAVGWDHPEEVVDWLPLIKGSEKYRDPTTLFLAQRWFTVDREGALGWLEDADLSPGMREKLLAMDERIAKSNAAAGS